ncbi:MAG: zinc-dependent alcohol dehydrogenase [Bryobacteraceae bacterium]
MDTSAAILTEPRGPVRIGSVPIPEPGPGEVLVRMEACGVCHSDLFVAGLEKLPFVPLILGHEGIGRVQTVGPGVRHFAVGDRAGITFLATTCGTCRYCSSGLERYCAKQSNFGFTLNGALTTYGVFPAAGLVRVPEALSSQEAAPLCCAGWTAYGALRESGLVAGQSVAIFGMGGLGHLAIQYARHLGLRVAAVDLIETKLEMARGLGAELALIAQDASRFIQKQWGGADAAVVLTGAPAAVQQAFRSVKRTGAVILSGLSTNSYELPIVDTVLKGISVRGSYLGTPGDLETAFQLAVSGIGRPHIDTHTLDEVPAVLERMRRGDLLGRAVVAF